MSALAELIEFLQQRFGSRHPVPDFTGLDFGDYLRQTQHFSLPAIERLRQLAIFLESKCSTGYPAKDWAVLRRLYDCGATIDPSDHALWWSRGITATHLAEIQGDPRLADTRLAEELFAEGEAAYRKALELAPGNAGILYSLGINAYMNRSREVKEARQWFVAALERDPGHVMAQLYLGHCCQDEGRWPDALEAYSRVDQEELARDWPGWRAVKLREQMAFCYMKCGLRDEAVRRFQDVLSVYEAVGPDQVWDLATLDVLIAAATGELRAELHDRTKACVEKNRQGKLYAEQFGLEAGHETLSEPGGQEDQ